MCQPKRIHFSTPRPEGTNSDILALHDTCQYADVPSPSQNQINRDLGHVQVRTGHVRPCRANRELHLHLLDLIVSLIA